jgi:hypothetical protein
MTAGAVILGHGIAGIDNNPYEDMGLHDLLFVNQNVSWKQTWKQTPFRTTNYGGTGLTSWRNEMVPYFLPSSFKHRLSCATPIFRKTVTSFLKYLLTWIEH